MAANIESTVVYDCVVVGAGVEGSAIAYKLAESGQRTLLLEQFELLHKNGSSHGGSRFIRCSYAEKCFADMAVDVFDEWERIEKLTDQTLFVKSGLLTLGHKSCPVVDAVTENLRRIGSPYEIITNDRQFQDTLPNTIYSADERCGILEKNAGILLASKAVACLQKLVLNFGGKIQDNCEVVDIEPGTIVSLKTKDGRIFQTRNLVLSPGTWAGSLAKKLDLDLPLRLVLCYVTYWKENVAGTYTIENGMTSIYDNGLIYGFPSLEYPGYVKIAIHGGYDYNMMNPEEHDDKPPYKLEILTKYIEKHFPGLESSSPAIVEKCKYTKTPDELFILDKHPLYGNIILAAGFSGTGFKMAPVVGNIIRNFIMGVPQKYDMECFKLNRFMTNQ